MESNKVTNPTRKSTFRIRKSNCHFKKSKENKITTFNNYLVFEEYNSLEELIKLYSYSFEKEYNCTFLDVFKKDNGELLFVYRSIFSENLYYFDSITLDNSKKKNIEILKDTNIELLPSI